MMTYCTVRDAIVKLLGDNAAGRFRVLGYQQQNKNSADITADRRLVQVYYSEGSFPKSAGRYNGSKTHDITIDVDMSVSAQATGALAVLEAESSTEEQRAAALAQIKTAAETADTALDETIEAVFGILMDPRNTDLGLNKGVTSSHHIERIQKDRPGENGDLIVKTASMRYTCRVIETVTGSTGNTPDAAIFNSEIPVNDIDGAGVRVDNINT